MRNIFNSFTGSFFRTIGRVLAYVAIALIVAFFLGFINIASVNAATISPNGVTIGGSNFPHTISVNTTGVQYSLEATASRTYAYNYEYAIVEICSTIGLQTSVYNAGYSYYFNDSSYLYNTNRSCTSSGHPGQIYYLFLSVGQWDIGNGNSSIYRVQSYLNLRSTWGYNGYVTFQKFMFSDEDMSIEIQQNQSIVNNINNAFNSLNQTQQDTNDKLDEITGAVDGIGDKVQDTTDKVAETNDKLDDLNDNITDSDTTSSEDLAGGFFEDFDNEDYGLSDIITMPLQVINNITSATCSPLELPLPFVDADVTLPCMYDIYEDYFGGFLTIYQTITFGIVAYWVCINIFRMVKNFKNPDNDEVEVLDL